MLTSIKNGYFECDVTLVFELKIIFHSIPFKKIRTPALQTFNKTFGETAGRNKCRRQLKLYGSSPSLSSNGVLRGKVIPGIWRLGNLTGKHESSGISKKTRGHWTKLCISIGWKLGNISKISGRTCGYTQRLLGSSPPAGISCTCLSLQDKPISLRKCLWTRLREYR